MHKTNRSIFYVEPARGVAMDKFLAADHLGSDPLFAPFIAFRGRRWILFTTSITYAATQIITVLAAGIVSIYRSQYIISIADKLLIIEGPGKPLYSRMRRSPIAADSLLSIMD